MSNDTWTIEIDAVAAKEWAKTLLLIGASFVLASESLRVVEEATHESVRHGDAGVVAEIINFLGFLFHGVACVSFTLMVPVFLWVRTLRKLDLERLKRVVDKQEVKRYEDIYNRKR